MAENKTKERLNELINTLEKFHLPADCTAAYHLDKAPKEEIQEIADEKDIVAHHRPNGDLYMSFKYQEKIDIYIWQ